MKRLTSILLYYFSSFWFYVLHRRVVTAWWWFLNVNSFAPFHSILSKLKHIAAFKLVPLMVIPVAFLLPPTSKHNPHRYHYTLQTHIYTVHTVHKTKITDLFFFFAQKVTQKMQARGCEFSQFRCLFHWNCSSVNLRNLRQVGTQQKAHFLK